MRFTKLSVICVILVMSVFSVFLTSIGHVQTIDPERLYDRASQQFWDSKYRQAEVTYRKVVGNHPDHSLYWDARFGLAKSLYQQGKLKSSLNHFRAVRQHHPNKFVRGDALYSLAEIAILLNRTIRAQRFLETFIRVFPEHVLKSTARKQLNVLKKVDRSNLHSTDSGRGKSQSGQSQNFDSAKNPRLKSADTTVGTPRSIINPLKSSSSDTSASGSSNSDSNSTETSMKANQPSTGTLISKSKKPSSGTSSSTTGRIRPFAGDNGSGTEADKTVSTMDGNNKPSKKSAPDTADSGERSSKSGVISRNESNTQPINVAGEGLSKSPNDTAPHTTISETSSKQTVPDQSSQDQVSSSQTVSKNTSTVDSKATASSETLSRAKQLYERGEYNKAKELINSLINGNPTSPEPYRLAAKITQQQEGSSDEVLSYLNKAIEQVDGTSIPLSLMKTKSLIQEKQYKEALTTLNRLDPSALSTSNREAQYHYLRGKIALERGNSNESFFYFMDAVRASPSSKWAERARTIINTRL